MLQQSKVFDQTLLIVEAMKVMNNISSPKSGIVEEVYVEDAQPIEYDQPLIVIKWKIRHQFSKKF